MVEQIVVTGLELATNVGIGYMAGTVAKALTPENASTAVKVCNYVAGIAVAGAVSVKADEYIEDSVKTVKQAVNTIKMNKKLKKAKKESEEAQNEEVKETVEEKKEEAAEEKAEKPKKKTKKEAV